MTEMHAFGTALRAKAKATRSRVEDPEEDSLFEDDDLFGSSSSSGSSVLKGQPVSSQFASDSAPAQLTRRKDTFSRQLQEAQSRLPDLKKNPQALRRSTIIELLRWADSIEQLEAVVDVVAATRGKLILHPETANTLIGALLDQVSHHHGD